MLNTVNFTSGFNTTVTIVFSNCGFPVWLSRYGRGLEGWEEEGDCNFIPASPWHYHSTVLSLGSQRQMTPHTLHQQKVMTVSMSIILTFLRIYQF